VFNTITVQKSPQKMEAVHRHVWDDRGKWPMFNSNLELCLDCVFYIH
jgi:hypothetical protein